MDVPARREDSESDSQAVSADADSVVTSHEPRPGKIVFTERNNADGWIATDLTVDLEP